MIDIKSRARKLVNSAVKSGALVRPSECQKCGNAPARASDGRATIQAHHHAGYELPLTVEWLCPRCHFVEDPRPRGEENGNSRLTDAQITEIRAKHRPRVSKWNPVNGSLWLANEYGVDRSYIQRLVRGQYRIDAALKE